MSSKHADESTKHDILSAIRPFVFIDTCAKVSGMIDVHIEKTFNKSDADNAVLRARIERMADALASVAASSSLESAKATAAVALNEILRGDEK